MPFPQGSRCDRSSPFLSVHRNKSGCIRVNNLLNACGTCFAKHPWNSAPWGPIDNGGPNVAKIADRAIDDVDLIRCQPLRTALVHVFANDTDAHPIEPASFANV